MVASFADNRDPTSLASRLRARRHEWFHSLVGDLPRPLTVLDVGGTISVWEALGFVDQPDIHITLINIEPLTALYGNVSTVVGDARDMAQFEEGQFDVVYSNSVIEHVGDMLDMRRMAREISRVAKHYFVQTPNKYFPVEPHFVFPLFQFLPSALQVQLLQRFHLGWIGRRPAREDARREIESIRLLSAGEMRRLFPGATIRKERLFGLTKSIIAQRF